MFTLLFLILLLAGEIATFIKVGAMIGAGWTVLLTLASALLGIMMLKHQAMGTMRRMQKQMAAQKAPLQESYEVMCLLIGAILLIIPGFITDTVGLLLFIPAVRKFLFTSARDMQLEKLGLGYTAFTYVERRINKNRETTIEGEYTRVSDKTGQD